MAKVVVIRPFKPDRDEDLNERDPIDPTGVRHSATLPDGWSWRRAESRGRLIGIRRTELEAYSGVPEVSNDSMKRLVDPQAGFYA
jgi:hypothetical protein